MSLNRSAEPGARNTTGISYWLGIATTATYAGRRLPSRWRAKYARPWSR